MKKFILSSFLFSFSVFFSLLLGEFHPFSKFSMHDSIPNWSYVFEIKNEKNEILFFKRDFRTYNACNASSLYNSIAKKYNLSTGEEKESKEILEIIGKEMMQKMKSDLKKPTSFSILKLYRKNYFISNDSLKESQILIYETNN